MREIIRLLSLGSSGAWKVQVEKLYNVNTFVGSLIFIADYALLDSVVNDTDSHLEVMQFLLILVMKLFKNFIIYL